MVYHSAFELANGVHWVGVKDDDRRIFDAFISIPKGTSYNAYLVKGSAKTALIDGVHRGFEQELEQKTGEFCNFSEIDYLIMNHAEPDHSGSIPFIMEKTRATLVATAMGAKMAQRFYNVPQDRILIVKEGMTIDLGGRTLRFIDAPMLHWPETMFTYLVEDHILFPCDFFGAHTAIGNFDDENPQILDEAQRYFGEIMMPFRTMAANAMKKLAQLKIDMIAPSHGPVYRNTREIIARYSTWTSAHTANKALFAYVSMYGSTEQMIKRLEEKLKAAGMETRCYNLLDYDTGDFARDLVDAKIIVLGTGTVLGNPHPLMVGALYLIKELKPAAKFSVVLNSYAWAGTAAEQMLEPLSKLGIENVGVCKSYGPPGPEEFAQIDAIAEKFLKRPVSAPSF
jgi:flavorubredoxin